MKVYAIKTSEGHHYLRSRAKAISKAVKQVFEDDSSSYDDDCRLRIRKAIDGWLTETVYELLKGCGAVKEVITNGHKSE